MLIDELVGFSNFYGSDPSLVLAGGGNTSAKRAGRMWVKGSGTALATITAQGFVKMDLSKLGEIFEKSYPDSDSERELLCSRTSWRPAYRGRRSARASRLPSMRCFRRPMFCICTPPR